MECSSLLIETLNQKSDWALSDCLIARGRWQEQEVGRRWQEEEKIDVHTSGIFSSLSVEATEGSSDHPEHASAAHWRAGQLC